MRSGGASASHQAQTDHAKSEKNERAGLGDNIGQIIEAARAAHPDFNFGHPGDAKDELVPLVVAGMRRKKIIRNQTVPWPKQQNPIVVRCAVFGLFDIEKIDARKEDWIVKRDLEPP